MTLNTGKMVARLSGVTFWLRYKWFQNVSPFKRVVILSFSQLMEITGIKLTLKILIQIYI